MTAARFDDVEGRDLDAAIHQRQALELTVYPKPVPDQTVSVRDMSTGKVTSGKYYRNGGLLTSYPPTIDKAKRLTDAELAAEVWHSIVRFNGLLPSPEAAEEARRNMILERFATLPHYDEAQP